MTVRPEPRFDRDDTQEGADYHTGGKPRENPGREMAVISGIFLVAAASMNFALQDNIETEPSSANNCSTTDAFVILRAPNEEQRDDQEAMANVLVDGVRNGTNVSHFRTLSVPKDWDEFQPKLKFPKTYPDERYKMATLHLDKGIFIFDFLRSFLSLIQPYDVPIDLLTDAIEGRISTSKLISESVQVEVSFLGVVGVCCVLCCVIPGTELWLACRPIKEDYKPSRHPGALAFLLGVFVFILGSCMVTMIVCNQTMSVGVEKIPIAVETALQDLNDYHSSTSSQLRKCLTRTLDVASEAILADLDNVEELLGKPVQAELSSETGLDVALDALLDLANASQGLSARAESVLKEAERARDLGAQLNRETDEIRRDLEAAVRACSGQDRPLCSIIDSSGLRLTLRMERLLGDDRLQRLRDTNRENLTEAGRQARGEYLYVPHHIARTTLDARNQIRREINRARARIFDEARSMEASSSELSKQLESARKLADYAIPYVIEFEHARWYVGLGTVACILPIWLLLMGALCCRCRSSEDKVRPTLLCGVFTSCLISIILWVVFIVALALSSHTEMLICRSLHDPDYRTMEAVLETRAFLGKRLSVPLKDLFEKCKENEAAYPAFGLGNTLKLDQLTAHWSWSNLSRAMAKLKVDLKGLRIFTPILQQRLQNLLYACGLNLTEHRIMIQGPIMNKDMDALSDQLDSVARQLSSISSVREMQRIGSMMRDLTSKRVKPLMKLQDGLVYQLAVLELRVQPLQRQVNQSISHLKTIQYYIDNQGENIAQLKTKSYVERLGNYLDQWRIHVLSEMGSGVAKCRPLWDILEGLRLLTCRHILNSLDGYWFATFLCALVLIASTPMAHVLSLVYRNPPELNKHDIIPARSESPDTVVIDRATWRTPDPPPSQESW
ncbi:hypothetical protein KM043_006635 [Ampulex compressa]|nr:hypothetical protein KM043_006635 [Ampulex compressa]